MFLPIPVGGEGVRLQQPLVLQVWGLGIGPTTLPCKKSHVTETAVNTPTEIRMGPEECGQNTNMNGIITTSA